MSARGLILTALLLVTTSLGCATGGPGEAPGGRDRAGSAPASADDAQIEDRVAVIDREPGTEMLVLDDRLVFPAAGSEDLTGIEAGDIVVASRDGGLLRRVQSVEHGAESIVMLTSPAALTEAVRRGRVSATMRGVVDGKTPYSGGFQGLGFGGALVGNGQGMVFGKGGVDITITEASFDFDPDLDLDVDIDSGSLRYFNLVASGQLDTSLKMNIELDDVMAGTMQKVNIWKTKYVFTQMIGWLPVVETVMLSVGVGFKANAMTSGKATVKLGGSVSASLAAGARYEDGRWLAVGEREVHITPLPMSFEGMGGADLRAFLYGEIMVKFYDVAGPAVMVGPYLGVRKMGGQPAAGRVGLSGMWMGLVSVPVLDHTVAGFMGPLFDAYQQWPLDAVPVETEAPPADDACGELTYQGTCEAGVLSWCDQGALSQADCTVYGMGCGWQDDTIGYNCVDGCGELDFAGACAGDSVRWCDGGQVHAIACSSMGLSCGWSQSLALYDCVQ